MALHNSIKTAALALPLAGAALVPDRAEACGPCYYESGLTSLEPINAAAIPIDGALLLQGATLEQGAGFGWEDSVDLTVTLDGQPIAGAVEAHPTLDVLIWRPNQPLEPGATYQVTGSFDNPESIDEDCGPDVLPLDFEFHVDTEASTPLGKPKVVGEESLEVGRSTTVDNLVCCDGAMPFIDEPQGECLYGELSWEPGFCTPLLGSQFMVVELTISPEVSPATAGLLVNRVVTDDKISPLQFGMTRTWGSNAPACLAVEVLNLATGEVSPLSDETCHGDALAGQIGIMVELDAATELAANCSEPAYVCALTEDKREWDPTMCSPWPGDGETTTEGESDTEGETDTAGEEPTTDGPTTGGPTTEGSATEGPETDGETADSASGGQDDGLVDKGCACDGGGPGAGGLLGLLGLAALRRRRRANIF